MRIIDNVNELLGDDLKKEISRDSKLRIAASTFSIFAFEALQQELEKIDELQFLFTQPSFAADRPNGQRKKQHRQFYIPSPLTGESSLYGTEFELRLRNKLTQKQIAKECADWVRRKVSFRSSKSAATIQQHAAVDESTVYFPIQGFTTPDLGYEKGPAATNFVNKISSAESASQFVQTFDAIWADEGKAEDVTAAVLDHIETVFAENSPARIYYLILYNIFSEFLHDIDEDVLPNELTGYKDTKIWNALYNFQEDAATGIINKLETYNGCILADSVGLGKTFTALAVIKYYELRNKSVLVLVPKKLAENWTNYNANLTTNIFVEDKFNYDVLAHTDLSRTSGESLGLPLDKVNWGNYDLVVIDESHNFRNAVTSGERESRYERLMREVIQEGVQTKVLMLSATPVNNRFTDLRNQLALAYEGDSQNLARKMNLSSDVETVFSQAQRVFTEWSKLPPEERTTEAILDRLDFDFFELLDAVTISRSRKHIQSFYDTSEIGAFPERLPPISVREPLTDLPGVLDFNQVFEALDSLTLAVYTPLEDVFDSRLGKYTGHTGWYEDGSLVGREKGLQRLVTTNLLKRLESSVEAFRLTASRLKDSTEEALAGLDAHQFKARDIAGSLEDIEVDDDDVDLTAFAQGSKTVVELADMDVDSWRHRLEHDRKILADLLQSLAPVDAAHDAKLQELIRMVKQKVTHPTDGDNRKVLIFSTFADTARYLYENLVPGLQAEGLEVGLVTGQDNQTTLGAADFQKVLTLFSPKSKMKEQVYPDEPKEIDVLIGTDCISEGQNLQDCDYLVNYDIHWNPVRIIQRFGRIDRIGSTNKTIQMVNFWPDISLDEYINLKARVEDRMVIADLAATGDDNVLTQEANDTKFRRDQLRRLQDEVIDLEDVKTGVSITDLGLNDFRMDLVGYVKEYGDLSATPKGLHAVVPAQPELGLEPGVIFALREVETSEHPISGDSAQRGNRLHPHYLVYLDDSGRVIADHTEAKRLLDLLRTGCKSFEEPVPEAFRPFNDATKDGSDMSRYSGLLSEAISSMIGVTEEQDIDSLFTRGATTALTQGIKGLDDFELIGFIAVVDPAEVDDQ